MEQEMNVNYIVLWKSPIYKTKPYQFYVDLDTYGYPIVDSTHSRESSFHDYDEAISFINNGPKDVKFRLFTEHIYTKI